MVSPVRQKSGFAIDVGCPGCGGALTLQEDFATIRCEHCSSALRITMPDLPPAYLIRSKIPVLQVRFHLDRFLKENGRKLSPPELEIRGCYHPYWKIDSMMLRVRNRIDTRVVESEYGEATDYEKVEELKQEVSLTPHPTTVSARPADEMFPYSLGLRTEYIKMRPYSGEVTDEEFEFNSVESTVVQAFAQAEKSAQKLSDSTNMTTKRNLSRLFGLRAALVYFPYFTASYREKGHPVSFVLDAVNGRVVGESERGRDAQESAPASSPQWGTLSVDFHRCTNCGEDLPTQNSLVYCCKNCGSVATLESSPIYDRKIEVADCNCGPHDLLMPFWEFSVEQGDRELVRRTAGCESEVDRLIVPAFRVSNFEAVYRVACRMTSAKRKIPISPEGELKGDLAPANIGVKEALIFAHAVLARGDLKRNPESRGGISFESKNARLLLVPFHAESYFLVDSVISAVTIERRAIAAPA